MVKSKKSEAKPDPAKEAPSRAVLNSRIADLESEVSRLRGALDKQSSRAPMLQRDFIDVKAAMVALREAQDSFNAAMDKTESDYKRFGAFA